MSQQLIIMNKCRLNFFTFFIALIFGMGLGRGSHAVSAEKCLTGAFLDPTRWGKFNAPDSVNLRRRNIRASEWGRYLELLRTGVDPREYRHWREALGVNVDEIFGDGSAIRAQRPYEALFGTVMELRPQGADQPLIEVSPPRGRKKLRIFPATFKVLPFQFYGKLFHQVDDFIEKPFHFVMRLPPQEKASLFTSLASHNLNAFAYLRFYIRGRTVVVTEIQSDVYRHLHEDDVKQRYRDWSKVLILAFENFLLNHELEFEQVQLVTEGFIAERWSEADSSIGNYLYHQVPKRLGYQKKSLPRSLLLERAILSQIITDDYGDQVQAHRRGLLEIDEVWERRLNQKSGDRLDAHGLSRFEDQIYFFNREDSVALLRIDSPDEAQPSPDFSFRDFNFLVSVLTDEVPLGELAGSIELHLKTLKTLRDTLESNQWTSKISNGVGFMSNVDRRHRVLQRPIPFFGEQRRQDLFHLASQSRHPFLLRSGDRFHASFKGAGRSPVLLKTFQDLGYQGNSDRSVRRNPVIAQVLKSDDDPRPLLTPFSGQRYWGGLTLVDAMTEYENLLGLHALALQAEGRIASAAIPFALHEIDALPVFEGSERNISILFGPKGYFDRVIRPDLAKVNEVSEALNRADYRLAILEMGSHSPLRIMSLGELPTLKIGSIARLIQHAYRSAVGVEIPLWRLTGLFGVLKHEGLGMIKLVDQVFKSLAANQMESLKALMILKAMEHLYQENALEVRAALSRIAEKSLGTIGLVHGAGGHLGGARQKAEHFRTFDYRDTEGELDRQEYRVSYQQQLGAHNGGAVSPRNMSVTGELFDLDTDCYLPWVSGRHWGHEERLHQMQLADLAYWEASMVALRFFFTGGSDLSPKTKHYLMQKLAKGELPFYDPQEIAENMFTVVDLDEAYVELRKRYGLLEDVNTNRLKKPYASLYLMKKGLGADAANEIERTYFYDSR